MELKLNYSFDRNVENAYIITMPNHPISIEYTKRCQQSCEAIEMPYVLWEAFDGSDNKTIKIPQHALHESFYQILKNFNDKMSISQIALLLSHISLWLHCCKIDKPIVILEHDAIMLRKFEQVHSYNAIVYLGCKEWVKHNWPMFPIPPFGAHEPNYRFILRAHAYAIDPQVAKNLLAHVVQFGLHQTADFIIRSDIFNITHQGLYAYDESGITTINNPLDK